jgi:antitoxin (DNA-binding transcriptional repressor) of toxin-antitoxin stability system
MTLVTVAEARENLPELLRRAAAGEPIVITEDGNWLAALGKAPPPPPTAEEEAARRRAAEKVFHEMTEQMRKWCAEDGLPFLPDEPHAEALKPESPAA